MNDRSLQTNQRNLPVFQLKGLILTGILHVFFLRKRSVSDHPGQRLAGMIKITWQSRGHKLIKMSDSEENSQTMPFLNKRQRLSLIQQNEGSGDDTVSKIFSSFQIWNAERNVWSVLRKSTNVYRLLSLCTQDFSYLIVLNFFGLKYRRYTVILQNWNLVYIINLFLNWKSRMS